MFDYYIKVVTAIISEISGHQQVNYWLGVLFAILSGIFANIGTVMMKKVVNEVENDVKFLRNLIKEPVWIAGLLLSNAIGTTFFIIAQIFIGPTLIPGLMAAGLIFLAIGSVKIVGEELELSEIFGIILMILAITLIGFSNMEINVDLQNFLDLGLIIRITYFTIILFALIGIFEILQKKNISKGISLSLISGFLLALSNFWISPLMGIITHVFEGTAILQETIIFAIASIILVITNLFSIGILQKAFREGQASNLIPIQQVPIQIAPPFYFLIVYLLPIPSDLSLFFLIIGIALVMTSSFLLARRQAEIEKIK
ncbi:MAG: hypothetical protein ACTSRG_02945 [Candidatus Helarchaeota archaeon]